MAGKKKKRQPEKSLRRPWLGRGLADRARGHLEGRGRRLQDEIDEATGERRTRR